MKNYSIIILLHLLLATAGLTSAAQPQIDESSLIFKRAEVDKPQQAKFTLDLPKPFTVHYPKGFATKSDDITTLVEFKISCIPNNILIDFTVNAIQEKFNTKRMLPYSYTLTTAKIDKEDISSGELTYLSPDSNGWQSKSKTKGLMTPRIDDFCGPGDHPNNMSREQAIYWYNILTKDMDELSK